MCEIEKALDNFQLIKYKSGNTYPRYRCKQCDYKASMAYEKANVKKIRKHRRDRKKVRRDWLNNLKSAPCLDCKQVFPPFCMEYDHRPGEIKKGLVSAMVAGCRSFESILMEIAKCDLVCANCHRIRTEGRNWSGLKGKYVD